MSWGNKISIIINDNTQSIKVLNCPILRRMRVKKYINKEIIKAFKIEYKIKFK